MSKDSKKNNKSKAYIKFSAIGIQMGAIIAAGAWFGVWLDDRQGGESKLFTIIFSLLGVAIALYLIIKEVIKMGKENE